MKRLLHRVALLAALLLQLWAPVGAYAVPAVAFGGPNDLCSAAGTTTDGRGNPLRVPRPAAPHLLCADAACCAALAVAIAAPAPDGPALVRRAYAPPRAGAVTAPAPLAAALLAAPPRGPPPLS
jgi:hypothetical protein